MVRIKFVTNYGIYFAGDIAGFEPKEAKRLVDGLAAEYVEVESEKPLTVKQERVPKKKAVRKKRIIKKRG